MLEVINAFFCPNLILMCPSARAWSCVHSLCLLKDSLAYMAIEGWVHLGFEEFRAEKNIQFLVSISSVADVS